MRGLLVVACVCACWRSTSPAPANHVEPQPPSRFSITIERTPCFGPCPTYKVRIDSDGRVQWNGIEHVAVIGARTRTVPPRRVASLADTLARIRFFERDAHGELPPQPICETHGKTTICGVAGTVICSDTSHSIITVFLEGVKHTVDNAHCAESPLDDLERQLDEIADTAAWIGD